jgi:N-acetylmuramoyl-L-alanine amidase
MCLKNRCQITFERGFSILVQIFVFVFISLIPLKLSAQMIPGSRATIHAPSFTFDKVVFVPLASFAQAYGMVEVWDPKTKIATIQSHKSKLSFRAGSLYALVNGKILQMPAEAKMMNGRLLIPFQFGLQAMKALYSAPSIKYPQTPKWIPPPSRGSFSILLDAGHGGNDVGARGRRGLNEKYINLDIAKRVRDKLQAQGIKVHMTRSRDEFVTLWKRTSLARSHRPSLFISIHTNAARNPKVNGTEIFYFADANVKQNGSQYKQNKSKSYQFARLVQTNMTRFAKNKSRGVKPARFFVLKNSTTPAVLIEVGFITNSWEESNLVNSTYRDKLAQAIAQSVRDFKSKN